MPHIIIKTIDGKSPELLARAAQAAAETVATVMDKPMTSFSVAVEEYTTDQWSVVFDQHIADEEKLVIKQGYSRDDIAK